MSLPWDHPDADPMADLRLWAEKLRESRPTPYPTDATVRTMAELDHIPRPEPVPPWSAGGHIGSLMGIPVTTDPEVPPGIMRFRWSDGRTEDVAL